MAAMADGAPDGATEATAEAAQPTLTDDDQAAPQRWVRATGLGSQVTDVEPLTGGSQNIVVRLHIDEDPLVLRRPPLHPRPTSDKTMQREIAVLRTLAGTDVPHPGFIAGCEDLGVLGVVFYPMEEVDGFNPGNEMAQAYVDDAVTGRSWRLSSTGRCARSGILCLTWAG
jgi:aminoglycoside phosphotransferase (APT) family kinase protein